MEATTCRLPNVLANKFIFPTFIVESRTNSDLPPPPLPPSGRDEIRTKMRRRRRRIYLHTHTHSPREMESGVKGQGKKERGKQVPRWQSLRRGEKVTWREKSAKKKPFRLCVFHKANQTASSKKKHNTPSLLDREATSREREGPSHTHTHTHTHEGGLLLSVCGASEWPLT